MYPSTKKMTKEASLSKFVNIDWDGKTIGVFVSMPCNIEIEKPIGDCWIGSFYNSFLYDNYKTLSLNQKP